MAIPRNSISSYWAPRIIKSTFKRRKNSGGGDSGTLQDTHDGSTCSISKSGWKNDPGWRKSVGISDVGLGYSVIDNVTSHGMSSVQYKAKLTPTDPFYPGTITYDAIGGFCSPTAAGDPNLIDISKAEVQAKSGAIQQAKALHTSFQGGVFLGELVETIHMVKNPAMALRHGIDRYYWDTKRYTKGVPMKHVQKILSGLWLEYQYGWKPLAADLEDAAKTIAHASRSFGVSRHFGGHGSFESSAITFGSYTIPTTGLQWRFERRTVSSGTISYNGQMKVSPGRTGPMRDSWGVSTRDFLPTVWELIPYSFLADYFTNVGEIIDGFSYCLGNLVYLSKSTKKRSRCSTAGISMVAGINSDTISHSESLDPSFQQRTTFNRNMVDSSSLIPSFTVKLPGSSTRFLNIAALGNIKFSKI